MPATGPPSSARSPRRRPVSRRGTPSSTARSPCSCRTARPASRRFRTRCRRGEQGRLVYFVFDLLHLDGQDLTGATARRLARARWRSLVRRRPDGPIRYSEPRRRARATSSSARPAGSRWKESCPSAETALRARPRTKLAEGQVHPGAGVRGGRLHRAQGHRARASGALLLGVNDDGGARLRGQGRHRLHGSLSRAASGVGSTGSVSRSRRSGTARPARRAGPLGQARAGRRGRVHRVDRGRAAPPPRRSRGSARTSRRRTSCASGPAHPAPRHPAEPGAAVNAGTRPRRRGPERRGRRRGRRRRPDQPPGSRRLSRSRGSRRGRWPATTRRSPTHPAAPTLAAGRARALP